MENFKIVNNFFVIYFVNSYSIHIFAPAFINQAETSTTKRNITIKSK